MQKIPALPFDDFRPLVEGMGYQLIDVSSAQIKNRLHMNVIIFSPDGISTGDCELVSKALRPRVELMFNNRDVYLEVSSPGVERKINSLHEFTVFAGKMARILIRDEDWVSGIIIESKDGTLIIDETNAGEKSIAHEQIVKARLVYQEVG